MTAQTFSDIPSRAINERDRALLVWLAAVKIASENQLIRHFWAATTTSAARRRLRQLTEKYRLLRPATVDRVKMATAGLEIGPAYELTPLGRDWLQKALGGEPGYESKARQYIHDLLVAEISVRLAETARRRGPGWASDWFGEGDIRPFAPKGLLPDGMGLLRRPDGGVEFAFFLELDASRESHGRPSSQIGRKIGDYDRYAESWARRPGPTPMAQFPPVLFITHGAERLANLAADIRKHRRRQPVAYGLALLDELLAAPDVLAAPGWRLLPADAKQADRLNQPLLNDSDWLASPAASRSKTAETAQASDVTRSPKATPKPTATTPASQTTAPPCAQPTPKPPSAPPRKPAATPSAPRPKASPNPQASASRKSSPPPRPTSPPPSPPPIVLSTYSKIVWGTIFISLTLLLMLTRYEAEISRWANATPTPTATATPDPFAHVPTATPYVRRHPRRTPPPDYTPFFLR